MSKLSGKPFRYRQLAPNHWVGTSNYGTYDATTEDDLLEKILADFPKEPPEHVRLYREWRERLRLGLTDTDEIIEAEYQTDDDPAEFWANQCSDCAGTEDQHNPDCLRVS